MLNLKANISKIKKYLISTNIVPGICIILQSNQVYFTDVLKSSLILETSSK